jgi:hypothetical protein
MEPNVHRLQDLFSQLGLPSTPDDIDAFVDQHSPLPNDVQLADAAFWTTAQAQFLREEILDDADWAEVVDQLNVMLRR